jgi:hypothetical protein
VTEPGTAPARPTRVRATGLALAAVLLTGCGSPAADDPAPAPPSSPEPAPPTPSGTSPAGPGKGAVPHEDVAPARTGEVRTKTARCERDGVPRWSFDGTLTGVGSGAVTFEVHESFLGDLPATFVVEMGAPVTAGHSEAAPSYSVGSRLLVSGSGDEAWGCGGTLYYDVESAADWRS